MSEHRSAPTRSLNSLHISFVIIDVGILRICLSEEAEEAEAAEAEAEEAEDVKAEAEEAGAEESEAAEAEAEEAAGDCIVAAEAGESQPRLFSRPTTIPAPTRAPQVASPHPIPPPKPEPSAIRASMAGFAEVTVFIAEFSAAVASGISPQCFSISGANSSSTAWQQLMPSACFLSTALSDLSISRLVSFGVKLITFLLYFGKFF